MTTYLSLLLVFACVFTSSSNPSSCRGRCGEGYYRGSLCQCDHECLGLNECCTDFLDLCTTKDSCKGRCGEPFNRGNPCHCDIDCVSYKQCCSDYENMCLIEDTALKSRYPATASQRIANLCLNIKNKKPTETSNEELTNEEGIGDELMIPHEESVSTPSEGLDVPKEISFEGNHTASDIEDNLRENSTFLSENQTSSFLPSTLSPALTADASSGLPVDENWMESVTQQPTPSPPQPQEKTSTAPTEGPTSVSQSEGPTSTAPTDSPTSVSQLECLTSTAPTESPTSASTSESSTSVSQTDGPTNAIPTHISTSTAPSEDSTSAEPPGNLTSMAPSEGPTSTTLTDVPGRDAQADGLSTTPTNGPAISEPVTESSLADPVATPVPKKIPPIPGAVKPTKKPTQPSTDKNGKSESKDPTDKPGEKPSSELNGKTESIKDYQADDYDTNICSGRPVSGLTTLRNGTTVAFRGHYFWTLDKQRNPDPPQLITRVWGIPSPIDTVYTRCNCQGKTYFFKGKNYWRFENGLMDPGFPKPISQGFGQIGHITAALSIPEYRSRKESVIFFKRGGMAQKYTYQVTPNCGKQLTNSVVTVRMRTTRQAAAALGQVINISKTWRGFPTVVTSAVSVPSRVREGYKYYVFSPRNYYSMKMEREKPVILQTATGQKENPATNFFKCKN